MKGRNQDQFVVLQYLADGLSIGLGLMLAYWLRFLDPRAVVAANYVEQFWWCFAVWMLSVQLCGCVLPQPRVISFNRARRLLQASALALLLVAVRNYFVRTADVSRWLYPLSFVTVCSALIAGRGALQLFISRFVLPRGGRTRVLIVGLGPVGLRFAARCKMQPELGFELVGFVSLNEGSVGRRIGGIPVLGTKDDLRRLIRDNGVEDVYVTQTDIPQDTFFGLFLDSERETARVHFVPSLVEMVRSSIHYNEVAGIPVYSMRETPLQGPNAAFKRGFDIVCASLGLLVLSPLFLLITILVKRTSPGPVMYKQTRLGLDGREFKIYKFRTMRVDAEKNGPGWGGQDDPRATRFGKWMRRCNIDELPQLWNVIRGDMSLVGPRPERPYYVDRFRELFPRYMSRHAVKTGMTGWAQVHGLRGETSIQQRLRYDLYYIENWSLWLDIKILMLTFFAKKRRRPRAMRVHFGQASSPNLLESHQPCPRNDFSMERPLGLAVQAAGSAGPSRSVSHAPER